MNTLSIKIKDLLKNLNFTEVKVGRSGDKVYNFENKYILKISNEKTNILREKEITDWLNDKDFATKSILFIEANEKIYYLRTCSNGESLIDEKYLKNPNLLIEMIVKSWQKLRQLDKYDCPYKSFDNYGTNFVHGDLCLPNIIVNSITGDIDFIDLGNAGKGDIYYDLSWLIWSFEHNLGTKEYTKTLLKMLNVNFDKEKYELYIPKEYR